MVEGLLLPVVEGWRLPVLGELMPTVLEAVPLEDVCLREREPVVCDFAFVAIGSWEGSGWALDVARLRRCRRPCSRVHVTRW